MSDDWCLKGKEMYKSFVPKNREDFEYYRIHYLSAFPELDSKYFHKDTGKELDIEHKEVKIFRGDDVVVLRELLIEDISNEFSNDCINRLYGSNLSYLAGRKDALQNIIRIINKRFGVDD